MKALIRLVLIATSFGAQGVAAQKSTAHAPEPIKEEMFITIGGVDQWITIKGSDRNNPILLNLHGGPGDAASPFADAMFAGWEKEFTLVQWDQRGAGRTYGKSGPSIAPTMTMERVTQDGIEVAAFLAQHMGKKKIIVMGGSWGSILGIQMIHARPDLFYAYVGLAQVVNMRMSISTSYARVLALARAAGDKQAVTTLTALGPPPWNALSTWAKFRKWEQAYQAKLATAPSAPNTINPAYASVQERAQWAAADDFNWMHFVGLKMSGTLMQTDLAALGTDFSIPIFMIQGQEDLTAPPELARAYFDSIKAPRKQFYVVSKTGHEPSAAEQNLARKVLIKQVRPLAMGS